MNSLKNKTNLKYLIFLSSPWIVLATGGIFQIDLPWQGLFIFLSVVVTVSLFNNKITRLGDFDIAKKILVGEKSLIQNNYIFFLLIIVLSYITYTKYNLSAQYNFNLAYVRNDSFSSDNGIELYGTVLNRMMFVYIFMPLMFLFLMDAKKFGYKHYIISFLYILSNALTGGRFALYHIFVIFLINSMFLGEKIFSFKKVFFTIILFLISFYILINRTLMDDISIESIVSSLKDLFESIYNYHSIQLGVMSFYEKLKVTPLGPFTGLSTPIIFLTEGSNTIEGQIQTFLDGVEFMPRVGGEYITFNAFGTSLIYFLPIFEWFGIIVFFFCVNISFYFALFVEDFNKRVLLFKYLLFSFFFSAFSPHFFSFQWWFSVLFICFLYKRKISAIDSN